MKKIRILREILQKTKADKIVASFVLFVLIAAAIIRMAEPSIDSYWDALWYSYVNLFTIGFGDIVPQTVVGRLVSVVLTIYATLVIAVVTGVVVAYYNEVITEGFNLKIEKLKKKADNIENMSKEELKELSEIIKSIDE